MDVLSLSQLQFAIITVFHFFFVPLTLGLSIAVAVMETLYVKTGDEKYKQMTLFWGKLFLINFALGVVTGIVQEFQFGMNWSNYSRFVGDIFGIPLAIEALLAFFLESTFIGLWIFGWNKLSKKLHLATIWLVAIASNLSALWILIANSFMQNPVGYAINNGRAELVDFGAVVTNANLMTQYPHVFFAGITTAGFFIIAFAAINIYRKKNVDFFRKSFQVGIIFALIGSVAVMGVGHLQGQKVAERQPMKMAAAEALWETEEGAGLNLIAGINTEEGKNDFAIAIPKLASFMFYNDFNATIVGINDLEAQYDEMYGEGDYTPNVPLVFWAFRIMVGSGCLMLLLALIGFIGRKKDGLFKHKLFLIALSIAIILPYLANSFGWIMTEVGRQPWIVYGLQTVADGVSPSLSTGDVWISLIGFTLVYSILTFLDFFLIAKYALKGPQANDEILHDVYQTNKEESLWI